MVPEAVVPSPNVHVAVSVGSKLGGINIQVTLSAFTKVNIESGQAAAADIVMLVHDKVIGQLRVENVAHTLYTPEAVYTCVWVVPPVAEAPSPKSQTMNNVGSKLGGVSTTITLSPLGIAVIEVGHGSCAWLGFAASSRQIASAKNRYNFINIFCELVGKKNKYCVKVNITLVKLQFYFNKKNLC